MAGNLPLANIAMAHPSSSELSQVKKQSAVISHHMVYYLLKEGYGIRLNGYVNGNGHSTHMRKLQASDKGFQDAISTLETNCKEMKNKYHREIDGLVGTLDISDAQLYPNFQESCTKLMDDDIRWGRIAVLFFFSSVLAKRLHREGQTVKIESLIGWLTNFLDEHISQWILDHGGWGAIKGAVNVEGSKHKTQEMTDSKSSWLTLAAVGVGAVIFGALTIR